MEQKHFGPGDNVTGNKTISVSVPIKLGIALLFCATAALIWYLNRDIPEVMPTAEIEFYTDKKENQFGVAGKPTQFNNISKNAKKVKWIFPNGETSSEDSVTFIFPNENIYEVKLQALSKSSQLIDEKTIRCQVYADYPENLTQIKIIYRKSNSIFSFDPEVGIGRIYPGWCGNNECVVRGVPKGMQDFYINGNAMKYSTGSDANCNINGNGTINIVSNGRYLLHWTNIAECTMKLSPL